MCGIIGYIGEKEVVPVLIDGLRRLEYRGYDSAGIALVKDGQIEVRRSAGKLSRLEDVIRAQPITGDYGVGHTRWATHGRPTEENAHPHRDCTGHIVVVHNGIIENYLDLKRQLESEGHRFETETDTEVVAHLVERERRGDGLENAVRRALDQLRGLFGVVLIASDDPGKIIAVRNGPPIVIGMGDGEFVVASDIPAVLGHTRDVVFLADEEMAVITKDQVTFTDFAGREVSKVSQRIQWDPVMAEKAGYKHFMLKEIFEQPWAVQETVLGRFSEEHGTVLLGELELTDDDLRAVEQVVILACGTSWHAGLVGKFLIEQLARVRVDVDYGSEYRYRHPIVGEHTLAVVITQSGETADTLAALREAQSHGAKSIAICNVVGSMATRDADGTVYTHAGPEIGVASTKAFTSQLVALNLLALHLGRVRGTVDELEARRQIESLTQLPGLIQHTLQCDAGVRAIAKRFYRCTNFLYLGRGINYPIALEGALKLKEISYIHAEGYPAGEMKHGPIALIDEKMPVVALVPSGPVFEKMMSNMQEAKTRGGSIIVVSDADPAAFVDVLDPEHDFIVPVPPAHPLLTPILMVVPLQLLAYHIAVLRGCDVDQPRNLAKSVTVESVQFLRDLNPEQREAVLHREGPLLILAGAGSGKTRVISYRAAYLIGDGHAAPDEVLAVTFTNKAAEEMRGRIETLLGSEYPRLWLSTFHAFCARLLRREAPKLNLSRDFVIYDSSDQLAVVRRAMRELDVDERVTPPRAMRSRISHAKNQMHDVTHLRETGYGFRDEQLVRVYERYNKTLADANALDFDDLLLKAVQLFDTSEPTRARYSEQFRYIMVDEYQDTNRPQYELIRHLAVHRNLCVVGDPDQSIYKWRGADVRNILDFEQDFPETTVVRLERNYRSTQVILDAASGVISRNRDRRDKRLWTEQTGGDPILYHRAHDELEEADFVVGRLRQALADDTDTAAVLYRTNAQSRAIEDTLTREGLVYRVVGGVRFYERKEVKDALCYLKLLLNPHDDVSLRRVINVPTRGIGKGVMEALDRVDPAPPDTSPLFAGTGDIGGPVSLWARLNRAVDEKLVSPRGVTALARFRDIVAALTAVAKTESASVTLTKTLDQTGYLQALRDAASEEAESRLANLLELVSAARDYELRDPDASLTGFVDRLSLLSEADEEQGAADARIWLMTLHAAKGLEFPLVIITGMEDGLFPHARASDDDTELEEERRLCYVGMTRAQRQLVLTGAARRRVFGEYQSSEPSRFLSEVPAELVQVVAPTSQTPRYAPASRRHGGWRGRRPQAPEIDTPPPFYDDADEDQSSGQVRAGMRVRHPTFGFGTVTAVEPLVGDVKLTVRFEGAGYKKLLGRYAKLEPA